jgi:hypothetical protein
MQKHFIEKQINLLTNYLADSVKGLTLLRKDCSFTVQKSKQGGPAVLLAKDIYLDVLRKPTA